MQNVNRQWCSISKSRRQGQPAFIVDDFMATVAMNPLLSNGLCHRDEPAFIVDDFMATVAMNPLLSPSDNH